MTQMNKNIYNFSDIKNIYNSQYLFNIFQLLTKTNYTFNFLTIAFIKKNNQLYDYMIYFITLIN